jgi:hypothetical protein
MMNELGKIVGPDGEKDPPHIERRPNHDEKVPSLTADAPEALIDPMGEIDDGAMPA